MKRTSTRVLSVALSAALASSLFGAPALAISADSETSLPEQSESSQEDTESPGIPAVSSSSEESHADDASNAAEADDASSEVIDASSTGDDDLDALLATLSGNPDATAGDELNDVDAPEGVNDNDLNSSKLEVTLVDTRPYMKRAAEADGSASSVDAEFSFALSGDNRQTNAVALRSDGSYSTTYEVSNLPKDNNYTLSVSGNKFAPYQHSNLDLSAGGLYKMTLYAGPVPAGVEGLGMIQYGSLKGTSIGDADVLQLLGSIEGSSDDSDLNGDGISNLVDLQIMSESIDQGSAFAKLHSTIAAGGDGTTDGDPSQDSDHIQAATNGIVQGQGSTPMTASQMLATLIDNIDQDGSGNETTVGIGTANGEAISENNPLDITFDNLQNALTSSNVTSNDQNAAFTPDDKGRVLVEGVSIKTPVVDNAGTGQITEGSVTAYYDDENGAEQAISVGFNPEMEVAVQSAHPVASAASSEASSASSNAASAGSGVEGLLKQATAAQSVARTLGDAPGATKSDVSNGVITINFGKRIAIKRITITVTKAQAASGSASLAEISSVQFLNNMEEAIKPPEMNIPSITALTPGSQKFTVMWAPQTNITGYEICIADEKSKREQVFYVSGANQSSKTITNYVAGKKGEIENNVLYSVKIQSVNGGWRSGWSPVQTVRPEASAPPKAPEKIKATGGYRYIAVSWEAPDDAESFDLYYRVKGTSAWQHAVHTENLNYTIQDLADYTKYEVYLTATNHKGPSGSSAIHEAETTSVTAAKLPNYMLLNTQDNNGAYFTHITSATIAATGYKVNDSQVDTANNGAMCLFDGKFESNIQISDWDLGTSYNLEKHGVRVTFDSPQKIGMISFAAAVDNIGYSGAKIRINGTENVAGCTVSLRDGGNGRKYTLIKLPREVEASEIIVGVHRTDGGRGINMAEMRFHGYNTIEDEIDALYDNSRPEWANMRIKLLDKWHVATGGANNECVGDVEIARLESKMGEQSNGEDYPFKAIVKAEIDYAKQLLADEKAGLKNEDVRTIHTDLADAYDANKNLGIGGLNAWQPLGRVAHEGQDIIVYVSSPNSSGTRSKIDLYIGQKYGQSSYAPKRVGTFANGRTLFTIPSNVFSSEGGSSEHGGRLYAQYTGSNPDEQWSVRILGAQQIPTLDLFKVTDEGERKEKVNEYVDELNRYVDTIKDSHDADHDSGSYNDKYCVGNSTDIMLDKMMLSIPAKQAKAACSGNADNLLAACDGVDQLMELFYQHKGLMDATDDYGNATGATGANVAPVRHLNIRCMQMTGNAFMYAAGNHIGVGYDSTSAFGALRKIGNNKPGQVKGVGEGKYFGWGTAHEIGHNINDSRYVHVEVTNNYFSQVCATINGIDVRWGDYQNVYDRVTSGAMGASSDLKVQLALYWQLALAYDNHQVYTMYDNYEDLSKNRFYARVDSYARNNSLVPGLATNADSEQNLVRLASAAAGKDLTEYFLAWGIEPSDQTKAFLKDYVKEERAIQYVNEATAKREVVRGALQDGYFKGQDEVFELSSIASSGDSASFKIMPNSAQKSNIHGFEVSRIVYVKGHAQKPEVVAFIQADGDKDSYTFTDDTSGLGNRMVRYHVEAIDKALYRSNTAINDKNTTAEIKMKGTGLYNASGFSLDTNLVEDTSGSATQPASDEMKPLEPSADDNMCDAEVSADMSAAMTILSNKSDRSFDGKTVGEEGAAAPDPYIIVDMGKVQPIEHVTIEFTERFDRIVAYELYLASSVDDEGNPVWGDVVSKGTLVPDNHVASIYLSEKDGQEGGYVKLQNARYAKLVAPGQGGKTISIKRLSLYGASGDDIEFLKTASDGEGTASQPVFGKLAADFTLDSEQGETIPAGSIVFVGTFKGNPAYSEVVLYDDNGTIVGGENSEGKLESHQVFLAAAPGEEGIGDTWDGRWIYWIEPSTNMSAVESMQKVRAELYRVDDAFTSEGERLVSDCGYAHMPAQLPMLNLADHGVNGVPSESTNQS